MTDNHKQEETIRCSGCKKQFFEDDFKVTRLGRRLKTCLECNDRASSRARRYKEYKESGTVDEGHGILCKRDPARIDLEAQRKYGFKLLDPENYANVKSPVGWECLTCRHRFRAQWKSIYLLRKCFGPNHDKGEAPKPQGLTDDELAELLGFAL